MKTTYQLGVATIILEGIGQEDPCDGNLVVVKATICLPSKKGYLAEELHFGSRLILAREQLTGSWGRDIGNRNYRGKWISFTGKTWKEAKYEAAEWAREEVGKLTSALAEREAALKAAGNWE